jgi:hypothetical protein
MQEVMNPLFQSGLRGIIGVVEYRCEKKCHFYGQEIAVFWQRFTYFGALFAFLGDEPPSPQGLILACEVVFKFLDQEAHVRGFFDEIFLTAEGLFELIESRRQLFDDIELRINDRAGFIFVRHEQDLSSWSEPRFKEYLK